MSTGKQRGFLVEAYASRYGEPRFKQEAHGYWLFVAGVLLGLVGLFVLAYSAMTEPRSAAAFNRRQVAAITGGVGLPLLMLGVVYRLPVKRIVDRVATVGVAVCLAAVAAFVFYYPGNWNVPAGSTAPDYALPITGVYGIGLLVISFAALVMPHTTETHEAIAEEAESEPSEAADTPAKSKAEFELYRDRRGEWRWNLRHTNGNIIADSAEGYSSKQKAKQGLESVRKNSSGAPMTEREEPPEREIDAGVSPVVVSVPEEDTMSANEDAKYEIYEDRSGGWRWRLVSPNGRTIADSGWRYRSRGEAEKGMASVQENAQDADHLDITPAGFEVYKDKTGGWQWRLIRRNGRTVADSARGYAERNNAMEAIERVQTMSGETRAHEDDSGEWRWEYVAQNGRTVADSATGYASREDAEEAAGRFEEVAPEADSVGRGNAYFTVYKDRSGEWRWRLVAANGRIIADSGEGYTERNDATEAIERVRKHAQAPTV